MSELHELTLAALAAALAAREVSSSEATDHALGRIAAFDGRETLNAYLRVTGDEARAEARAADDRRTAGGERGSLDGVPIGLKDLFDTAGVPTTGGSPVFAGRVPATDATVVTRLREAGAVSLGKTNMLEFAYGYPHPEVGETANPWDLSRTAGGSSGGSAAAVAAGMGWGALGSDTGGSIRSPAAYCGVTGLKPSYGLASCAGVLPLSWSLDHVGPIARTAEDCALLLAAIAGYDPADPHSVPAATASGVIADIAELLAAVRAGWATQALPLRGMRIGTVRRLFDLAVTPGLREAVEEALPVLSDLGAELVEVDLDPDTFALVVPTIERIYPVEAAAYHRPLLAERAHQYGPVLRAGLEAAVKLPAVDYVDAQRDRLRVVTAFEALYERVDLLAWPAQPLVAPPLGTTDATVGTAGGDAPTIEVEIAATGPANLTGEPSIAVPCGSVAGLPVGLLLQGPRFADARVLRTAVAYQAATGAPPLPPLGQGTDPGRVPEEP